MALHEKLTSLAKDAATKANSLAKDAASKANTAIENGKLSLKINNEQKKIDEFTLNIGELILDKLDGGESFDDEIMALYSSIQAARDVITAARADIEANRQSAGTAPEEEADGPAVCAACGMPLKTPTTAPTAAQRSSRLSRSRKTARRKSKSASALRRRRLLSRKPRPKRAAPAAAARPGRRRKTECSVCVF